MTRATRVSRLVRAPRAEVYRAMLDASRFAAWLPPAGMRGIVHAFDARPGGEVRMSLVYDDPAAGPGGKTTADTDTFAGRFVALEPDRRIALRTEFASDDPQMAGEMVVSFELEDAPGGTRVTCACEGVPPGVRLEDNEAGSRSSLDNLAALFA